jgi:hypothetical protein
MRKVISIIIAIGLCFVATGASAQTVKTNVPGLVVKNVKCDIDGQFLGSVVNRSARELIGSLKFDLLDADGDPVDTAYVTLFSGLAAGSGHTFARQSVSICRGGGFKSFRATYTDR